MVQGSPVEKCRECFIIGTDNMYVEKRGNNMIRLRRLRGSEAIRNMVRENRVNKEEGFAV